MYFQLYKRSPLKFIWLTFKIQLVRYGDAYTEMFVFKA